MSAANQPENRIPWENLDDMTCTVAVRILEHGALAVSTAAPGLGPAKRSCVNERASIVVENVSRSYGEVRAVQDVSFRVGAGEVVGLLGPNGAGKTTTLRMLATLIPPDEGRALVGGHDVVQEPLAVRGALGYQTGDTGLYGRLTPPEFLRYFGDLHGIPQSTLEPRIAKLVEDFDITPFADRLCGNLSTGQKQRVTLARTLLHDPPVVVLDEPTSGLDIVSAQFILDTLQALAAEGRAVLFSTHIMTEVELICQRAIIIHKGRVIADDDRQALVDAVEAPNLGRAFLRWIERDDQQRGEVS